METPLSLHQFRTLALQYQKTKRKARIDCDSYICERYWRIKKRCRYLKNVVSVNV